MHDSIQTPMDVRKNVTAFLALLSSTRAHETLSKRIDPERLAFEFVRTWFDEIYVPSTRYVEGLKGDYSERAARRFQSAFAPEELDALERFHRFAELRLDMLPEDKRGRIPIDDRWRSFVRDARYLLEDLDPQADALRVRLEDRLESGGWPGEFIHLPDLGDRNVP